MTEAEFLLLNDTERAIVIASPMMDADGRQAVTILVASIVRLRTAQEKNKVTFNAQRDEISELRAEVERLNRKVESFWRELDKAKKAGTVGSNAFSDFDNLFGDIFGGKRRPF